jgi:large subunit ribosomal protein L12
MEYIYAALLLHRLQQPITEDNVKKVIAAVGVTPNEVKIKALISALSEINIDEAIKNATLTPLATPAPAAAAAPAKAPEAAPAKQEKKKGEEKKGEEEALAGLASLFG